MTIRSIGLRDDYGVYHIVCRTSITHAGHYAREFGVYRATPSAATRTSIGSMRCCISRRGAEAG